MKPAKKELLFATAVSVYIVVFLLVFQPFEVGRSRFQIILISSFLISGVHFVLFITTFRHFENGFNNIQSKLFKEVFHSILFIFIVALVSKIIHSALGLSSFKGILYWVYATFWVLSIPYGIKILINYKHLTIAKEKKAKNLNESGDLFKESKNLPDFPSTLTLDNLYYMKAEGNYTSIAWNNNGSLENKLFRGTIKFFESKIIDQDIKRCHRSYIINTTKIKNIKGNSRGYKAVLIINDEPLEIPISPDYRKTINI